MKKPVPIALLTFVPMLLVALFLPTWIGRFIIVVLIADVSFFRDVSYQLRDIVREKGSVPYPVRYPFFVFAAGLLAYCAISFGYASAGAAPIVAIAGATLIAASKFLISRGPLWPYSADNLREVFE
jgi:hypothetical protein